MRLRSIIGLASLSLVLTATAQAYQPVEQVVDPAVVAVARAQWPGSPCTGYEQVEVVADLNALHPELSYEDGNYLVGYATFRNGACDVQIDDSFMANPYDQCRVLAHEFGHLAARNNAHTMDDPVNIMSPVIPADFAPCDPFKPAPPPPVVQPTVIPAAHPVKPKAKPRAKQKRSRKHKQRS